MIKRLFRVFRATTNTVINLFENPVQIMEQCIIDLKLDLKNLLKAMVEIQVARNKISTLGCKDQEVSLARLDKALSKLKQKVEILKTTITEKDAGLTILRARAKAASSLKKINEQNSCIDISGTLSTLDRMEDKVAADEALADAYDDIDL